MNDLIELAREDKEAFENWLRSADTEVIRKLLIHWDNEQYLDFSRKELLDTVMEMAKEGAKGRDEFTREELIADVRDNINSELDDA